MTSDPSPTSRRRGPARPTRFLPPFLVRLGAALLLWLALPALASDPSARLDATSIAADRTVRLVLESSGEPTAEPDLSVLSRNFEIVDRRAQRSVSIVNGRRSERYLLTLTLLPRRSGLLEIPPIPFGDSSTQPLRLTVGARPTADVREPATFTPPLAPPVQEPAPAGERIPDRVRPASDEPAGGTVLLEAALEPNRVWVRQQAVLTVKVFMDAPATGTQLHDPQVADAKVLPLGEDRYDASRDGRGVSVYERRYAVFPQKPGRLEIPPLVFEGWSRDDTSVGQPPRERPVRSSSQALSIEVLPAPPDKGAGAWLPARTLTLTESGPETYRVRAGTPVERRISLRADGLQAEDLPAVTADAPHQLDKSRGQPHLWDERHPQGVIGTRAEVIVLTAQEPGRYRLPPLSLAWWSTDAERWESAMLPARDLVVTAAAPPDGAFAPPAAVATPQPATAPAEVAASPPEDRYAASGPPQPRPEDESGIWIWISTALGLAWLATMTAWWRGIHRGTPSASAPIGAEAATEPEAADPLEQAIAAVHSAYETADAARAREALLDWGRQVLPDAAPSNLARLAQRCPEPLRGEILMLEEAFFSPRTLPWERQRVWEHMRHFQPAPAEEPASFRRGKPLRRHAAKPSD